MQGAATELIEQPSVHRAKGQLTPLRARSGPWHLVEQPLHFGGGKIGIEHQTGTRPNLGFQPLRQQGFDQLGSATALPDNGRINRLARNAVPDQCGFALIGHANTGHLLGGDTGLAQHLTGDIELRLPNLLGIVLHPIRLRIMLWKWLAGLSHDLTMLIKQNGARATRALIKSKNICGCHVRVLCRLRDLIRLARVVLKSFGVRIGDAW